MRSTLSHHIATSRSAIVACQIVFYSRGRRDGTRSAFPSCGDDINHEYWHLRENDPKAGGASSPSGTGLSRVIIKFSFGNCLDDTNEVMRRNLSAYVPDQVSHLS